MKRTHETARRRRVILYIAGGVLGALLIAFVWVMDFGSWVALDEERLTSLSQTALLFDANDAEIAGLYSGQNRIAVPLTSVPTHVQQAFIAAEDARFYSHSGIDVWRIGGAAVSNVKSGGYSQGASTITQQLVKLTHLSNTKKLSRKANEAWLAMQVERLYGKDEILEMYLNTVYFGHGAYGIEAAARAYYGKSASELSLDEGALMAAVIKSPSGYAPHLKPERALERRNLVLREMEEQQYITANELDKAIALPIKLNETRETLPEYGWFIDGSLDEAATVLNITQDELLSGGYMVYTTLDTRLQALAERTVATAEYPADAADGTPCQVAFSAVDTATGAILCCVGGREYTVRRGLNRAIDSRRQPGSALKPLAVYAPAVDSFGYLPTSFLNDIPTDFDGYSPRNAGGSTKGIVTLRQTVSGSINIPTVELLQRIGIDAGIAYLNDVGITTDARDEYLPLALGAMTYGVSTTQLSAAYAPFANGGTYREPYCVREIQTADGTVVYKRSTHVAQVLSRESAYIMTSMLRSVVTDGTGRRLAALDMAVAGKTGTSALDDDGNRDAWMAAYTPRLSAAVWMGFDNTDSAHRLPATASGSNQPAKFMASFLNGIGSGYASGRFSKPEGVTEIALDKYALESDYEILIASENTPSNMLLSELFTPRQLPGTVSTLWDEPLPPRDLSIRWSNSGQPRIEFTCMQDNVEYVIERTVNGQSEQATTLTGNPGERVTYIDDDAYGAQQVRYTITPRQLLTGDTGSSATGYLERSLWDSLGTMLGSDPEDDGSVQPTNAPTNAPTDVPTDVPTDTPSETPTSALAESTNSPEPESTLFPDETLTPLFGHRTIE